MKIVVASDSFKGCLTSAEVGTAIARGVRSVQPDAEVVVIPVADGGEGTYAALSQALDATTVSCPTVDPLHRPIVAEYALFRQENPLHMQDNPLPRQDNTLPRQDDAISGQDDAIPGQNDILSAIIDVASSCGLSLVAEEERRIMSQSSRGVGMMISDALKHGCRHIYLGLGGSATCDAGLGLCSALGFRFLDANGQELPPIPSSLPLIASITSEETPITPGDAPVTSEETPITSGDAPIISVKATRLSEVSFTVIADVSSPLCGPHGAARMFAPQKGATPAEVELLEAGMHSFAGVLREKAGSDVAEMPSAGAAGGIGAAMTGLLNARVISGVDAVLDLVGFDRHLDDADLVITGEGRIDSQTLMGKLPAGVCRRARSAAVPTIAFAGSAENIPTLLKAGFAGVFSICQRPMSLKEAMEPMTAAANLAATAASVVSAIATTSATAAISATPATSATSKS